jgi:hypothetical protein
LSRAFLKKVVQILQKKSCNFSATLTNDDHREKICDAGLNLSSVSLDRNQIALSHTDYVVAGFTVFLMLASHYLNTFFSFNH